VQRYIGALLLVGASAWAAAAQQRSAQEQKAIDVLTKLGGKITVDQDAPGKPVAGVDLSFRAATDAMLKELAALQGLRTLDFMGCEGVTDVGLKELAALRGLHRLSLVNCQRVSDAGVADLKKVLPLLKTSRLAFTGRGRMIASRREPTAAAVPVSGLRQFFNAFDRTTSLLSSLP
jgi:hypothetical protein